MRFSKFIISCFILLSCFATIAQEDSLIDSPPIMKDPDAPLSDVPNKSHRFSIRLTGGVPNPLSSQLFRKKIIGIYEANINFNFRIGRYLHFGAGINNTLFSISNRTKYSAHTKLQLYGGFLRIGYDKYHHSKMFSSFYLNTGYTKGFYTGVVNMETKPHNLNVEMVSLQPTYSINFFAEERMTLGFYGGFHYMLWQFNPDQINLADTGDISKFRNSGNSSFWIIGLEMYIGLGKR